MREGDAAFEALREAIDAFAADRAPELVAEARAEALAKVRSMLAEAMAQSLLDHSAASLGAGGKTPRPASPRKRSAASRRTSPPGKRSSPKRRDVRPENRPAEAERHAPASPPDEDELGYYVYGVVSTRGVELPADLRGVDPRSPATLVEAGRLAAIVSRVSLAEFGEKPLHENLNDVAWLEDKARAHEEILDAALSRMTVVPMRLCTIYRGEEQVREMLVREQGTFVDALHRLEGKAEWGVKLIAEPGALERTASAETPDEPEDEEGQQSPGLAYLNEKRRQSRARDVVDRLAEAWAEAAHDRLAATASEALLNPLQPSEVSGHTGEMLLNGVYLVESRETDSFRGAVEALEEEYAEAGVSVELTGPWPPYNFVKSSIEAAR